MANEAWQSAFVEVVPDFKNFRNNANREMSSILGDAGDNAGFGSSERFGNSFVGGIGKFAAPIAGAFAALGIADLIGDAAQQGIDFLQESVTAASDLNESGNAVKVTFGEAAAEVQKLGESAATRLGLSANDFNAIATRFSSFAGTIAGDSGDVVSVLDELTTRGSDFASVYNLEVSDALGLFQSALAGETEPLRAYGIDVSAATVAAYAYANGIAEQGKQLTESQRVQATYGSLLAQTSKTQGDFANTSNELANSQRIVAAEFENIQAELGTALLPAITQLAGIAKDDLIPVFSEVVDQVGPQLGSALSESAPAIKDMVLAFVPLIPQIVQLATQGLPPLVQLMTLLAPLFIDGASNLATMATVFNGFLSLIAGDTSALQLASQVSTLTGSLASAATGAFGFAASFGGSLNTAVLSAQSFASNVITNVQNAVNEIAGIPGKATAALGDLGNTLFSSGQSLIGGFIRGIESSLKPVGDAVGGVLDFVADHFPNSPAKRGPFSGSGWTSLASSGAATAAQYMAGFNKTNLEPELFVPSVSIPSSRVSASGYAMANPQVGSKAPIAVTVNGAPGQSAETVGRVVVDGLNFTQRVAG